MTRNHRRLTVLARARRSVALPLLAAMALFAAAGTASAADAVVGSGTGTGYSDIDVVGNPGAQLPPCLPGSSGSKYILDDVPAGVVKTTTQQYTGPLTVTITITEDFYFSPAGIFEDDKCTLALPQSATLAVSTLAGQLLCPADDGAFSRVNTALLFEEPVEDLTQTPPVLLDGTCTVGGVTVGPPVNHTFAGNEYPCLQDPFTQVYTCPAGIDQVHVQGTWTAVGAS